MAIELRLTRRFRKSFEKLDRETKERVKKAVGELAENPGKGKQLKGELTGEWSLRVGNHRVLYALEGGIAWIETVRHRREAYR